MSKNIITADTNASASPVPANVQISNITDSSFTVSYTTPGSVIGSVNYGKDGALGSVALDIRDQKSGTPEDYYVHYFTITGLSEKTTYYFSISSEGTTYLNNGSFYTLSTGPVIGQNLANPKQVSGSVILSGGGVPSEALVTVSTQASQVLSALVNPDGSYTLSLTGIRTLGLDSLLPVSQDTVLQMAVSDQTSTSLVKLLAGQASPVPLITLSQDYDFTIGSSSLGVRAETLNQIQSTGFPPNVDTSTVTSPKVAVPLDNEKFHDAQPQFSGKSIPNSTVSITVQSSVEQLATLQADKYGNWVFRPSIPLAPGVHTINIQTPDITGVMQTITRSFTVYAAGSSFTTPSGPPVLLTATPALPTPTTAPTQTPMPPTPTTLPTPTITPIVTIAPTTLPVTGSSVALYGAVGMVIAGGMGLLLFIF